MFFNPIGPTSDNYRQYSIGKNSSSVTEKPISANSASIESSPPRRNWFSRVLACLCFWHKGEVITPVKSAPPQNLEQQVNKLVEGLFSKESLAFDYLKKAILDYVDENHLEDPQAYLDKLNKSKMPVPWLQFYTRQFFEAQTAGNQLQETSCSTTIKDILQEVRDSMITPGDNLFENNLNPEIQERLKLLNELHSQILTTIKDRADAKEVMPRYLGAITDFDFFGLRKKSQSEDYQPAVQALKDDLERWLQQVKNLNVPIREFVSKQA